MLRPFTPGTIDYNGSMATNYPAGRALSAATVEAWLAAIDPFVPRRDGLTILDLGSGTGRFSTLLSAAFGARVIGVEPAVGMRTLAAQSEHPPEVSFVAGTAERLPLGDSACDVAWMSQVLHHLRDHDACAGELRRVLRPGGVVLIRSVFTDGKDGFPTLLQFFPGISQIFSDLPTVPATIAAFDRHGFVLEARRRVEQQTCASLQELADRTRLRADTSLTLLSDSEFESCQTALDMAAARETRPTPVLEELQLLVFRAGPKTEKPAGSRAL